MTLDEAMRELEAQGSEQARKTYRSHGVSGELFGVSYAALGALKKRIKTDHDLARGLWASGNHDARVLATMVADPTALTPEEVEAWAGDLGDHVLTDALVSLVARSPELTRRFSGAWRDDAEEWRAAVAWKLLAHRANGGDPTAPDDDFLPLLEVIRTQIHGRPNRVREAMNGALITIGCRSDGSEKAALEVAAAVGRVDVDHGATSCKTPDAAAYIRKTREHRAAQAAKRGGGS